MLLIYTSPRASYAVHALPPPPPLLLLLGGNVGLKVIVLMRCLHARVCMRVHVRVHVHIQGLQVLGPIQ